MSEAHKVTYDPTIFDVGSMQQAQWVAVSPDGVHTSEERWEIETEYLMEIIDAYLPPRDATALDFGCGPGRLAKPLIERKNWSVLGVEISPSISVLATEYVKSERFLVCNPQTFDQLLRFEVRADFALALWVLQHCPRVDEDIARIKAALKPGGRLLVLNACRRFVPTQEQGWIDDGIDVWRLLQEHFLMLRNEQPDASVIPPGRALWGVFERR
jgi:SAM-dependent methyltransferase